MLLLDEIDFFDFEAWKLNFWMEQSAGMLGIDPYIRSVALALVQTGLGL